MSGKWTPGPWHVADTVMGNGERLIRDSRIPPQLIATVVESDRAHPAVRNAALIRTSPRLYDALARLVAAYDGGVGTAAGHTELLEALDHAQSVLAEARQES